MSVSKACAQTQQGLFITFEGADGCGKTTQIHSLSHHLTQKGIDHVCTREPGGCAFSEKLRSFLLGKSAHNIQPLTQALLMTAARREHIVHTIQPALLKGTWVLSDRFMDSTTVYQGHVQGVPDAFLQHLHAQSIQTCIPDLTIILTFSPELSLKRLKKKKQNHFDAKPIVFHKKVQEGFVRLAQENPQRYVMLSGEADPSCTTQKILHLLSTMSHLQSRTHMSNLQKKSLSDADINTTEDKPLQPL